MAAARGSVLVVDDEPVITEVVAGSLERAGYATSVAASRPEAVEVAAAQAPDLAVLDVMLPGFDGLEVMRRLRDRDPDGTRVILLTARGEAADRIAGLREGADDHVVKPFSLCELVARVEAVLRRVASSSDVSSGQPRTVGDPARALVAAAGKDAPSPEVTGEFRLGDVRHVFADATRAAASLNFTAEVPFEAGVAEFAAAPLRGSLS